MKEIYRFSAPGRTEISGNHTDHQHGCVLAAAPGLRCGSQLCYRSRAERTYEGLYRKN